MQELLKAPVSGLHTWSPWITWSGNGVWASGRPCKRSQGIHWVAKFKNSINIVHRLFLYLKVLFPTEHIPPKIAELFPGPKGKAVLHSHSEASSVAPEEDGSWYQLAPPRRTCRGLFSALRWAQALSNPLSALWELQAWSRKTWVESRLHYFNSEPPWIIHITFLGLSSLICRMRKVTPSQTCENRRHLWTDLSPVQSYRTSEFVGDTACLWAAPWVLSPFPQSHRPSPAPAWASWSFRAESPWIPGVLCQNRG